MKTKHAVIAVFPLMILGLAGCAAPTNPPSTAPSNLGSSSQLRPDSGIRGAYIYHAPTIDTARYHRLLIEPTVVYTGPEASFPGVSDQDKQRFAQSVTDEFRKVLSARFQIADAPAADVVRVRVTLIGVKPTTGGLATATRVIPIGAAINAVRGATGMGGSLTGGIELAVEILDSQSNDLLASVVRNEAPGTFDIEATLSTNDTVSASARGAAESLRDAIVRKAASAGRK